MAKTYKKVAMMVDGSETAKLDCFKESNTFSIFEHDANVFAGTWGGYNEYIENWLTKWSPLAEMLKKSGHKVEFIK